ncbi:primosomal protein N' [Staphylococcus muscae]|uniref:Replication restart protein PriA n=1 Tax=Staphylococcus muscae TaxID=1294 RepID=A0A240C3M8_9STAP|nr:primosomal protein N' [Staphylococcus muscae]AVQ32819.1 primosomal protein N' [Staphylococcus muscae]PNZ05827.1 primosomal protein N' [Staphylococcus muscae]GGA80938.1 primosomal protein N' [Staphylococcus muscae]SNW01746.1 primosomal protein N' [Staphylococcus muscae]
MIAQVIVDVAAKSVDRTFDYLIPDDLKDVVQPGVRVLVPFGPRKIQGYVMQIVSDEQSDIEIHRLKPIFEVKDIQPELTEELVKLSEWYSHYFVSKRISILEVMLPSAIKAKYTKAFSAKHPEQLPEYLRLRFNQDGLYPYKAAQNQEDVATLLTLMKQGIVEEVTLLSQHTTKKKQRAVRVIHPDMGDSILMDLEKKQKQYELLAFLLDEQHRSVLLRELKDMNFSTSAINTLERNGIIEKYDVVVERDPYEGRVFEQEHKRQLTEEQQEAFDQINRAAASHQAETFLLHGVTGSGKTEVYLQIIDQVLERQQEAMMLVPEIALTPQMVQRFKSRFGDEVAVLHSGLSHGERYDEWQKIRDGRARVSVGARSSVFAPFKNLGVIIIDEEHEATYKQEDYPRYHAREIAEWRSRYHHCPLVLGSATPSLESYARATRKVYTLLSMPTRVNNQQLPEVKIRDMRDELANGNRSIFSEDLAVAIEDRLQKQEQVVLFLNRRGYASFMLCRDCGHVPQCPNCDISMTYHKTTHELKCHYCGYHEPAPFQCPSCGSEHIQQMGTGTQRVEELIQERFPSARIIRMDVDTTSKKGSHEKLLKAFGDGKGDILLGTQMIAKGLDFPNITLVGVLNADTMLNLPDFRSSERTYQLLTQVAGRAGRHEKTGEVIIQTYNPDHYAVQDVQANNYLAFYEKEMQFRQLAKYPPYFFLINFTVTHEKMKVALQAATHVHQTLLQHVTEKAFILGPAPAALSRINNEYRFQILLKYKHEPGLIDALRYLDDYYHERYEQEKLALRIDIGPYMMM